MPSDEVRPWRLKNVNRKTEVEPIMDRNLTPSRQSSARRGVLTIEMLLTLPILLLAGLSLVQFSLLLLGSQAISAAAHSGVRQAALPGATIGSVRRSVDNALEGWSFKKNTQLLIFVNDQPVSKFPLDQARTGDKVSVTVRVGAAQVAPNALSLVGITIAGTDLQQTFVMRVE